MNYNDDYGSFASFVSNLDAYTLVKDYLKNLWVVILAGITAVIIVMTIPFTFYHPSYVSSSTLIVAANAAHGINYAVYTSNASDMANILKDEYLLLEIAEDMGVEKLNVKVEAETISDTNLISLKVTADKPTTAFRVCKGLLEHYFEISDLMMPGFYLYPLVNPAYPEEMSNRYEVYNLAKKAGLITLVAMSALILLCSYFFDSIKNEKDVKNKLSCDLYGAVYHERKYKSLRMLLSAKKWRKKSILISTPLAGFGFVESYKRMREKFSSRCLHSGKNSLVVTSMLENEGKSTVAANMAIGLACISDRVVLLDADIRKPAIHKVFEVDPDKEIHGVIEYLKGEVSLEKCLYKDPETGVFLLCAMKPSKESSEYAASSEMAWLIKKLKGWADYLIIDTPPMELVADAEAVAALADYSLLVIKPDNAPTKAVNDCIDRLGDCASKFLGCVLNNIYTVPLFIEHMTGFPAGKFTRGKHQTFGGDYGYGIHGYGYGYGSSQKKVRKKNEGSFRDSSASRDFFDKTVSGGED